MRVLSLFAGIGGFDLGLERTGGFRTVAMSEIDPFASRVLAKHFPAAVNIGDVTTAEFPDADFICAGFPCQDISFAGAGAGLAGARSGLWREVVRALRVVRPRGALLENVAALLNRGLDRVLGDMAEIGYDAEWHCIPASAVGAPHRRDRIWIIANPGSEQHEGSRPPISGEIAAELSRAAAEQGVSVGHGQEADTQHPDANCFGSYRAEKHVQGGVELRDEQVRQFGPLGEDVAYANGNDVQGQFAGVVDTQERSGSLERQAGSRRDGLGWWAIEPDVGRVAHGVSQRVDRLKALGNAVVPQIPELIGRAILAAEADRSTMTAFSSKGAVG